MKTILASLAVVFALTACNVSGSSSAVPGIVGGAPRETQDLLGGAPTAMQSVRFANGTIHVQPSVTAANAAAQVTGTIKNRAGKPVANAAVLATDLTGHLVNVTATASDGTFTLHALPPGAYTIAVKNSHVTASGETITATGNDAGAAPSQFIVLSPEDDLELNSLLD
jgi:phosphatidate phosphatase APP1